MPETVSRREILKILTATGGGLIAAAFLPQQWLKPVVKAGVLPVHARASATTATVRGTLYQRGPLDLPPDAYSFPLWDGINVYVDGYPAINDVTGSGGDYTLNGVPLGSQTIVVDLAGAGITLITTPYSSDYAGLGMGPGGVGSDETGTSQALTVVPGTNTLDFRFTIS